MNTFYFQGIERLDLGLGNPNKAGAVLATWMIGGWVLAWVGRRGFWGALALFAGLGVGLVWTFSRGGLLAVIAGMIPVAWALRPRMGRWRWTALALVVAALTALAGAVDGTDRLAKGVALEDPSAANRLVVWSSAPAMMADAPGGWGFGRAADAYHQWYQPPDREERYLNLINTHLTWMVEMGWVGRFLYAFGWAAVLAACWPSRDRPVRAVAFGVWLAFGVAGWFSCIADVPWVWSCPVVALVASLVADGLRRHWPDWRMVAGLGGAAGAVTMAAICVMAWMAPRLPMVRDGNVVFWGPRPPTTWVLCEPSILGRVYGKTFRSHASGTAGEAWRGVGFVDSLEDLSGDSGGRLIAGGRRTDAEIARMRAWVEGGGEVLLLNPWWNPDLTCPGGAASGRVRVAVGDFSQSPFAAQWRSLQGAEVIGLPGAGDFVPDWPRGIERLLTSGNKSNVGPIASGLAGPGDPEGAGGAMR